MVTPLPAAALWAPFRYADFMPEFAMGSLKFMLDFAFRTVQNGNSTTITHYMLLLWYLSVTL